MKAGLWCVGIGTLLLVLDWAIGYWFDWRKRRDTHITAERMRRWNVTAFRGARYVDKNRWLS